MLQNLLSVSWSHIAALGNAFGIPFERRTAVLQVHQVALMRWDAFPKHTPQQRRDYLALRWVTVMHASRTWASHLGQRSN